MCKNRQSSRNHIDAHLKPDRGSTTTQWIKSGLLNVVNPIVYILGKNKKIVNTYHNKKLFPGR